MVNLTPTARTSFYLNFDYGRENRAFGSSAAEWVAIGAAGRLQTTTHTALALRYENYNDRQGFITGTAQCLNSFTLTGEYKWVQGLLSRLEYRRDWSDQALLRTRIPRPGQKPEHAHCGICGLLLH